MKTIFTATAAIAILTLAGGCATTNPAGFVAAQCVGAALAYLLVRWFNADEAR